MPYPWSTNDILTASDLNDAIGTGIVSTGLGAWASYSPTWTASGTPPVLGDGTLVGRYAKIGQTLHWEVGFIAGSSTTFGTGTYRWGLPEGALSSGRVVGYAVVRDAGDGLNRARTVRTATTTTIELVDAGGLVVAQTVPFTWASSDQMFAGGTIETAA